MSAILPINRDKSPRGSVAAGHRRVAAIDIGSNSIRQIVADVSPEGAIQVVDEMKAAGVYVFAGGLEEEDGPVYSADPTSGTVLITDGPYIESKEFLGGFAVVDVADDEAATMWAGKVAEACGWPHEVRRFKPRPTTR